MLVNIIKNIIILCIAKQITVTNKLYLFTELQSYRKEKKIKTYGIRRFANMSKKKLKNVYNFNFSNAEIDKTILKNLN